ncbi:MAG: hypothetical protein BYD32DRAFT_463798 [Podila humilis]|nr:MAG: hypothetical protein BYD32DRAFT_463798 [Podila humilis]
MNVRAESGQGGSVLEIQDINASHTSASSVLTSFILNVSFRSRHCLVSINNIVARSSLDHFIVVCATTSTDGSDLAMSYYSRPALSLYHRTKIHDTGTLLSE